LISVDVGNGNALRGGIDSGFMHYRQCARWGLIGISTHKSACRKHFAGPMAHSRETVFHLSSNRPPNGRIELSQTRLCRNFGPPRLINSPSASVNRTAFIRTNRDCCAQVSVLLRIAVSLVVKCEGPGQPHFGSERRRTGPTCHQRKKWPGCIRHA